MQFATTGALANELMAFLSTGSVFLIPMSTSSVNQPFVVADRQGDPYLGVYLEPARVSGASTGPLIGASLSPGVGASIWYGGIFYGDLVTNGADYLYVTGSSSGAAVGSGPYIRAAGVDTDIDLGLDPKGDGVIHLFQNSAALGGGAGATLGTIGGSGPGVAGQAFWLRLRIGTSTGMYFIPVWST